MNTYKKKICVVTGSRADYGLLKEVILKIKKSHKLKLILIATGTHLSEEYGYTLKEIVKDKFRINEKIKLLKKGDSEISISESTAQGIKLFGKAFKKYNPQLLLILGDRFEIFSAATAAMLSRIPIGHIHGGEITEGAIDDSIRHSITKMSHIHFVAHKAYKKNVIQLGESPKNVFVVGGMGAEYIKKHKLLNKGLLEKKLNFKFFEKNILVNFHPETLSKNKSKDHINKVLDALKKFKNVGIIFTMPNSDHENRIIYSKIKNFTKKNKNSIFFKSLGSIKYLSCLKYSDVILGNSSSGLLEAPTLNVPTINLGERQKGRLMAKSVFSLPISSGKIIKFLESVLKSKKIKSFQNPYADLGGSDKIIKILEKAKFKKLLKKKFFKI